MIGSTNGKLAYSTVDKVSITLLTDDNAHDKLMGVIVTVSYDDKSTKYIWDGKIIKVKIPTYSEYSISVSSITGYATPTVFTAIALINGETVVDLIYSSVVDLSRVDIYGNPIALTTANCYVIKEAGTYEFPLVYGTAIKNGEINTSAYNSENFRNGMGNKFTSPYIEDDTAVLISDVLISIADVDNVLSNLLIIEKTSCKYIKFTVNNIPLEGGNLILSVKSSSGIIMWSWHIWLWPHDLTPVEITNNTGVTYNILPVNLATKLDTADSINTTAGWNNLHYQWGRPTPTLPSTISNYGVLNYEVSLLGTGIGGAINSPNTVFSGDDGCWFYSTSDLFYDLWDAACTSTGCRDNKVVKTVYDPCPIGFNMPNGNVFNGFYAEDKVIGSFDNGWWFKRYEGDTEGIFFPNTGYSYNIGGIAKNLSLIAYSASYSHGQYYGLGFNESDHALVYAGSALGSSIRPVKDEDYTLPTHKLTINVGADNSVLPSGFEIKVYQVIQSTDETTGEMIETLGNVLATQTTASATHEIAWGTTYCIVANDCTGYTTPSNQTFVASLLERGCNVVYEEIKLGVYIQGVSGKLYNPDNWASQETPNGVAVITEECSFVIALKRLSTYTIYNDQYLAPTLDQKDYYWNARDDLKGVENTAKMMQVYGNTTTYAAGACSNFVFPNNKNGYLGSAGEWYIVYLNFSEINSALKKAGGSSLALTKWTSTRGEDGTSGDINFWAYYQNGNNGYSVNTITKYNYVRPFTSI